MENKTFLMQIKHTSGNYEKGVVVKDTENAAIQSFHAYFGAYGYENDKNTDYVQCMVVAMDGRVIKSEVWDNRPVEETTNVE